ncbi:U32 family peptidase [bacterium]|nr:U32 family peptidase [bacterium]MBR2651996.1 U32 family peptidase [bacterium]MBR2858238.1 U32 family peptidase [bacterium]
MEKYLKEIQTLKIDKVVFNDFAVAQIDFEQNLNLNLHYEPSALVTSYGQLDFYQENKINSVSLSNELFLPEVTTILKNKPANMQLCLQVQGFVLIMHSR